LVTRWDRSWEQHKKDIYESLIKEKGERKAKMFIEHYALRYDKYNRPFLDWQLAVELYKDYVRVGHNKIAWYAIVGAGGVGKSELAKNCAYFLDADFTPANGLCDNFYRFTEILKSFPSKHAMRAAVLDEPDVAISPSSEEARALRPVFGKARAQQLFLFFCATEMSDIPNFVYKRLNNIIFLAERNNTKGVALLYKDRPKLRRYYMGRLKKDYMEKLSYSVFFEYEKKARKLNTYKGTPFTVVQEAAYEQNKENDYINTLDRAHKTLKYKTREIKDKHKELLVRTVKKFKELGYTNKKIADTLEYSDRYIGEIIQEYEAKSEL
jgi:hypothetical protein